MQAAGPVDRRRPHDAVPAAAPGRLAAAAEVRTVAGRRHRERAANRIERRDRRSRWPRRYRSRDAEAAAPAGLWGWPRPGPAAVGGARAGARAGRGAAGAAASSRAPTRRPSSASRRRGWAATERLHERFGDDAVYVVVREPITRVVLTEDLNTVLGLEGCLSGNVPPGRTPAGGARSPCGRLARSKAGARRVRPGDVPQRVRQPDLGRAGRADRAPGARLSRAGRARGAARAQARLRRRRRRGATASRPRRSCRRKFLTRAAAARRALRPGPRRAAAAARQPAVRRAARIRPGEARRHAEDALRVDLPRQATAR